MKTVLHKADTRGHANHGWLNAHHTFSFARYYDPARVQFGKLRVLNDDIVKGGGGFGTHPHDNMEIVTIPLTGALEHKDSMGNSSVIRKGEVQIMSAGTGIMHSEFNHSKVDEINLLQIWVFPEEMNIKPRYDQKVFDFQNQINTLQTVVSPEKSENSVWINQDAYFTLGNFEKDFESTYTLNNTTSGVYLFVIEGGIEVADAVLNRRDGLGVWEAEHITLKATSANTEILLIEVPMS